MSNPMNRRTFLRTTATAPLALSLLSPQFGFSKNRKKQNIVIIVADDLGWNDVSCHGSEINTPNIDRFMKEGIELNQFYTCPVCSPTRAGLLTGRYPIRFGLMRSAIPSWEDFGLSTDEVLLPQALEKAGYANRGIFGKWHLGHSDLKYHPLRRGFTHFYGHYNGAINYFTHKRDGELDWHRNYDPCYDEGYSTDLVAAETAKFIEQKADEGPVFCYVPFNAPHGPLMAPEKYLAQYEHLRDEKDKNAKQIYAAMVTCMDDGIGKILGAIDRAGIMENTLVLFFSDNGGTGIGSSNTPLRQGKSTVFEGGIRVPAAIRYPAALKGGRKIDDRLAYIDIFPSLMKMIGITDHGGKPFDGIDASGVLTGSQRAGERDIYSYLANEGDANEMIAVSDSKWKLICLGPNITDDNYDDSQRQFLLFRIDQDPYEQNNLWDDYPDIGKKLYQRLKKFRALQVKDRVLPYRVGRMNFKKPKGWPPKEWNMELYPEL